MALHHHALGKQNKNKQKKTNGEKRKILKAEIRRGEGTSPKELEGHTIFVLDTIELRFPPHGTVAREQWAGPRPSPNYNPH